MDPKNRKKENRKSKNRKIEKSEIEKIVTCAYTLFCNKSNNENRKREKLFPKLGWRGGQPQAE